VTALRPTPFRLGPASGERPDRLTIPTRKSERPKKGQVVDGPATGTLARGLQVMDLLLQARQPMTLAEIADAVALDHSTTLRLLRSLEELKQVIRLGQGKKYLCSPKALRPLPLLHPGLAERVAFVWKLPASAVLPTSLDADVIAKTYKPVDNLYGTPGWFNPRVVGRITMAVEATESVAGRAS